MKLKLVKNDSSSTDIAVSSDEATIRNLALQSAKNFKACWKDLAKSLAIVWKEKFYKEWGYQTFDAYTAKEIKIRKNTAMKLIHSYHFLEKEEPQYLQDTQGSIDQTLSTPTFEAVNMLRLAKKKLEGQDYETVKKDMLEKNRDLQEVKKDLTSLIRQRKDIDPEAERIKSGLVTIKRCINTLKSLKHEAEILKLLPAPVIRDIAKIIQMIEEETKDN